MELEGELAPNTFNASGEEKTLKEVINYVIFLNKGDLECVENDIETLQALSRIELFLESFDEIFNSLESKKESLSQTIEAINNADLTMLLDYHQALLNIPQHFLPSNFKITYDNGDLFSLLNKEMIEKLNHFADSEILCENLTNALILPYFHSQNLSSVSNSFSYSNIELNRSSKTAKLDFLNKAKTY